MRLKEAATELAEDLKGAGLSAIDHIPAKIVPPLVLIGTGDPYVEEDETFDNTGFVVHMELFLMAGTATNSAATDALNTMIETVIFNLGDWTIDSVSAPFMATANSNQYLTSRVNITNQITIGGQEL